jgi:hypothetical protein
MNPGILFMLKAEREAEDMRQARQPVENNWFVQIQLKNSAKAARSKMNLSDCSDSIVFSPEQTH